MAELRKSSLASVCQDLWKHQVESCFLLVNHDCCWKTKQPSRLGVFFIVMFLEYKGITGDLVSTLHCGAADRRDLSPSASVVTTLCTWTPQALPTVCKYVGITWDGGWCERPCSAQAVRHSSTVLSQPLLIHGKIPGFYSTVIATTGTSSFLPFGLKLVSVCVQKTAFTH